MITIRRYKSGDLGAVVAVFQGAVREVASRDYAPAQIAAWAPQPPDLPAWSERLRGQGVFVADAGHTLAGFAKIDDQGHIDLLFVHPGFQGQGVARLLFEAVMTRAASLGLSRLSADVSITARPFFECMGFQLVRTQEVVRQDIRLRNFVMCRNIGIQP